MNATQSVLSVPALAAPAGVPVLTGTSLTALVFAVDASNVALSSGGSASTLLPAFDGKALASTAYSIADGGNGAYTITFSVPTAGASTFGVYVGSVAAGNLVGGAAVSFTAVSRASASKSARNASALSGLTFSSTSSATALAGDAVSLGIAAADAGSNALSYAHATEPFSVTVTDAAGSPCLSLTLATFTLAPCLSISFSGDHYIASGSFQTVGTYAVRVALAGATIVNGTFSVTVSASAAGVSGSTSTLADNELGVNGLLTGAAGTNSTFYVYPRDAASNAIAPASLTCAATTTGAASLTGSCVAYSSTAFRVSFAPTVAGAYTPVVTLTPSGLAAVTVAYSGGSMVVSPGPVSALRSTLNAAPSFTFGTAATWSVAVTTRDAYGNAYSSSPGDAFTIVFTPNTTALSAALTASATDNSDGTFTLHRASDFFPAPANYSVSALYGGASILNSPRIVSVAATVRRGTLTRARPAPFSGPRHFLRSPRFLVVPVVHRRLHLSQSAFTVGLLGRRQMAAHSH